MRPRLDRARRHPGRESGFDDLGRPEVPDGPNLRPAVDVLEGMGFRAALGTGALDVEHERPFEAVRWVDREVLPVERDVVAVGSRADVAPPSARTDIHLDDPGRRPVGTPPSGDDGRIREGLPDLIDGRVERALEDEVAAIRVDGGRLGATPVD